MSRTQTATQNITFKPFVRTILKKKCLCTIDCQIYSKMSCPHSPNYSTPYEIMISGQFGNGLPPTYSYANCDNDSSTESSSYCSEIAKIQINTELEIDDQPTQENLFVYDEAYEVIDFPGHEEKPSAKGKDHSEYLTKFSKLLETWRSHEKTLEREKKQQKPDHYKFMIYENHRAEEIIPSETTYKWTYEDLSTNENREHFLNVLKSWSLKEELLKTKGQYTSTPVRNNHNQLSLEYSTIYDHSDESVRCRRITENSNLSQERSNDEELNYAQIMKQTTQEDDKTLDGIENSESFFKDINCSISINSDDLILGKECKSDSMLPLPEEKPVDPESADVPETHEDKTKNNLPKTENSVTTNNVSSLVSGEDNYYGDEEFRRQSMENLTIFEEDLDTSRSVDLEILREEIRKQNEIVQQISKALFICKKSNKWGLERAEAEKILLLATIKYSLLLSAIHTNAYKKNRNSLGSMRISNLKFTLIDKQQTNNHVYYLCVIKSGTQLKSTKIIEPLQNLLYFNEDIKIEKLSPEEDVFLQLYALKNQHNLNHRRNYKNKLSKTFQKMLTLISCFEDHNYQLLKEGVPEFQLVGESNLTKYATNEVKYLYLTNNKTDISIGSVFDADVHLEISFDQEISGHVNMGKEIDHRIVWNRRWCRLTGMEIKYYNFPSEEISAHPAGTINLQYLNNKITSPKFNDLMRSKTLQLEIKNQPDHTDCIYYFTFDSHKQFKEWQYRLHVVVENMISWKILKNSQA